MVQLAELKSLPAAERLQLVEDLWDSLAEVESDVPVSQWQQDELARREEYFLKNPSCTSSWEDVKARIRSSNAQGD